MYVYVQYYPLVYYINSSTLADRGWKTSETTINWSFSGRTVNLPGGNLQIIEVPAPPMNPGKKESS